MRERNMRYQLVQLAKVFGGRAVVRALPPELAKGHNQEQILTERQTWAKHPQQHNFPGHNQTPNVVPPKPQHPYKGADQPKKPENPHKQKKYKELPRNLTNLALNQPKELSKLLKQNHFTREELNEQDYSGSNVLHYAVQGLINSIYIKDKYNDYLPPTEPKEIHLCYENLISALIKKGVEKDVQTLHYGRYANKPIEIHLETYNNTYVKEDFKIPKKIYDFLYQINTALSVSQPKAAHDSKKINTSTPNQEAEETMPATIQATNTIPETIQAVNTSIKNLDLEKKTSSAEAPKSQIGVRAGQTPHQQRQPQVRRRQQTPQGQPNANGAQKGYAAPPLLKSAKVCGGHGAWQRGPQGPYYAALAYGAQRGYAAPPKVDYRALAPQPTNAFRHYEGRYAQQHPQWQNMMLAVGEVHTGRMYYVM